MNIQEAEIIKYLALHPFTNQRELAENCGCSVGMVNRSLKSLEAMGYLTKGKKLSAAARRFAKEQSPRRAVILAAGAGMRMVPVNMEHPKAMLEVHGEILIERLIRQLHEAGIREIYVVVGFMKEAFEYLIDEFGVELIVNRDYAAFNNLHSLALVKDKLSCAYILPCDIWCRDNPFCRAETYSWYMVKASREPGSEIRANRKQELIRIRRGEIGNPMVGISYLGPRDGLVLQKNIELLCQNYLYDHAFWEEALYQEDKMLPLAKVVTEEQVLEINTYRQLRELQLAPEQQVQQGLSFSRKVLQVTPEQLGGLQLLKKGITNRTYLLNCENQRYVLRIPVRNGEHTVDRSREQAVYAALQGKHLADDVLCLDPHSGYRLSRYMDGARCCEAQNEDDVRRAMGLLRTIHALPLEVPHTVDLFERIDFYESLRRGQPSSYQDYERTKAHVLSLRPFIDAQEKATRLTHIDPTAANFLLWEDADGAEQIRLIDWEYAAMQDPHIDVAMFGISALYSKEQMDWLIDLYFEHPCPPQTRIKLYCYVAVCALMWSNWCEYQMQNGAEFGEYSLRQYRYAKEFYRHAVEAMAHIKREGSSL